MLTGSAETETATENPSPWTETNHPILPMMTALLVEGLQGKGQRQPFSGAVWLREINTIGTGAKIFRVPIPLEIVLNPAIVDSSSNSQSNASRTAGQGIHQEPFKDQRQKDARSLIRWISHRYNNLLMAIWGNVTLIRMQLEDDDPLQTPTLQMEQLIQSGAFLIHMVLGYLAERRAVAKRLRMNQLIQEMQKSMPAGSLRSDELPIDLEARLKQAARIQTPAIIAEATGKMMAFLFERFQGYLQANGQFANEKRESIAKWTTIGQLVRTGLQTTDQLLNYSDFQKN